jgi:hypothetical protein
MLTELSPLRFFVRNFVNIPRIKIVNKLPVFSFMRCDHVLEDEYFVKKKAKVHVQDGTKI